MVEERDGELGVRATFRKRYITLAPVAGVVGIGLDLQDPQGLLKDKGAEGFTVALLERGHEGLRMGPRHVPLTSAFMNGTGACFPLPSLCRGGGKRGEEEEGGGRGAGLASAVVPLSAVHLVHSFGLVCPPFPPVPLPAVCLTVSVSVSLSLCVSG